MAVLNELMAEAVDRCRELTRDADEANEAVSSVADKATLLANRAAGEEEEAHGHIQALTAKLAERETELERLVDGAATGLQALDQKAEQAEQTATELQQRVEKAAADLEQRRAATLAELEHAAEQTETQHDQLGQAVQALGDSVEARTQQALQGAKDLRDATVSLADGLQGAWQQVDTSVSALEDAVEAQVQAAADRLADALALKNAAFVELGEKLVAGHNRVVEEFVKDFVEASFGELQSATEPLRTSIESLEGLCDGSRQALAARFTEIEGLLNDVAQVLQRIRPVAELAGLLE
jgi:DNA repair exonuclease SbcCD ATPase subunit